MFPLTAAIGAVTMKWRREIVAITILADIRHAGIHQPMREHAWIPR
jgi:hypothetical protein